MKLLLENKGYLSMKVLKNIKKNTGQSKCSWKAKATEEHQHSCEFQTW